MIYVIKVVNEWGEEQGVFGVTTSRTCLTKMLRKYMRTLKIEFDNGNTSHNIPMLSINEINNSFQGAVTKGETSCRDYVLYVEEWENGYCDDSYLI
jgi:hypothetical protein